jgi:MATE family multidrug resistance protein
MTDLENIKSICLSYSVWIIIIPFISSFCYQFDGIFVGASKTKELRNAMIISVGIYLLTAFLLVNFFGNLGLWISLSIFFFLRGLTLFLYLGRIYKVVI